LCVYIRCMLITYKCMYVYIYIYTCVHVCAYIHTYIYIYSICMCVCAYIHIYVCVYVYICMYICVCVWACMHAPSLHFLVLVLTPIPLSLSLSLLRSSLRLCPIIILYPPLPHTLIHMLFPILNIYSKVESQREASKRRRGLEAECALSAPRCFFL
jgi:hypothetical protein